MYRPRARQDLVDIWDFTLDRWGEEQADAYIRRIVQTCEGIADGSQIGFDAQAIRPGLRRALVNVHVVFYRELDDQVVVVRVLHQRMDAGKHID